MQAQFCKAHLETFLPECRSKSGGTRRTPSASRVKAALGTGRSLWSAAHSAAAAGLRHSRGPLRRVRPRWECPDAPLLQLIFRLPLPITIATFKSGADGHDILRQLKNLIMRTKFCL